MRDTCGAGIGGGEVKEWDLLSELIFVNGKVLVIDIFDDEKANLTFDEDETLIFLGCLLSDVR